MGRSPPGSSLSMGFSRQEYKTGLLCIPPGDLPHPRTESGSLKSPGLVDRFFITSATTKKKNVLPKYICISSDSSKKLQGRLNKGQLFRGSSGKWDSLVLRYYCKPYKREGSEIPSAVR